MQLLLHSGLKKLIAPKWCMQKDNIFLIKTRVVTCSLTQWYIFWTPMGVMFNLCLLLSTALLSLFLVFIEGSTNLLNSVGPRKLDKLTCRFYFKKFFLITTCFPYRFRYFVLNSGKCISESLYGWFTSRFSAWAVS